MLYERLTARGGRVVGWLGTLSPSKCAVAGQPLCA